jgi:hypothetical protein
LRRMPNGVIAGSDRNLDNNLPPRGRGEPRSGAADASAISGLQRSYYDNREQRDRERDRQQLGTTGAQATNRSYYQGGGRREEIYPREDRRLRRGNAERANLGRRVPVVKRSQSAQNRGDRSNSRRVRNRSSKRFSSKERAEKASIDREKTDKDKGTSGSEAEEEKKSPEKRTERRPRRDSRRKGRSQSMKAETKEDKEKEVSPSKIQVYAVRRERINKQIFRVKEMLRNNQEEVEIRGLGHYSFFDAIKIVEVIS